jgi:tRNA threonylcarbamoyladenosine biosynthesis protein TsaE
MTKHLCRSLAETEAAATLFLSNLAANKDGATVVGLLGDLGSGKTTFTQAIARQLGVTERVTSPTFVIEKNYRLENQPFSCLIHIDAYRLHKPDELAHLQWSEIIADSSNLVLIEWADRVFSLLPPEAPKIMFHFIDQETREIKW